MTDRPPAPPPGTGDATSDAPVDPGRRRFFRQFAGDVASAAGNLIGSVAVLQQQSADAARELLAGDAAVPGAGRQGAPAATGRRPPSSRGVIPRSGMADPGTEPPTAAYRSPFRWDGDRCVLLDQRGLPDATGEHAVTSAYEAAAAIREQVVIGGPAIAQVAAIGLALTAAGVAPHRPHARQAAIRGAANALRNAAPVSHVVAVAIERMLGRYEALGGLSADPAALAEGMRAEAAAVVFETADALGRLTAAGRTQLPPADPLRVLTLGSTGVLAGGQLGTALGVITTSHHAGRAILAFVAETGPSGEGARIAAWELAGAGVPCEVVADAAAASLIAGGEVDVVLVGAERIARNGDLVAITGTYPLALAAAAHGVPFVACAPSTAIDPTLADAASFRIPAPDAATAARAVAPVPAGTSVRAPAADRTPAALVSVIVTDAGTVHPPFAPGLERLVASAEAVPA